MYNKGVHNSYTKYVHLYVNTCLTNACLYNTYKYMFVCPYLKTLEFTFLTFIMHFSNIFINTVSATAHNWAKGIFSSYSRISCSISLSSSSSSNLKPYFLKHLLISNLPTPCQAEKEYRMAVSMFMMGSVFFLPKH